MGIICKMVKCSSTESKAISELDKIHNLAINTQFTFGSIVSSNIKIIEFDEDLIIINTLNAQYKFKK